MLRLLRQMNTEITKSMAKQLVPVTVSCPKVMNICIENIYYVIYNMNF